MCSLYAGNPEGRDRGKRRGFFGRLRLRLGLMGAGLGAAFLYLQFLASQSDDPEATWEVSLAYSGLRPHVSC